MVPRTVGKPARLLARAGKSPLVSYYMKATSSKPIQFNARRDAFAGDGSDGRGRGLVEIINGLKVDVSRNHQSCFGISKYDLDDLDAAHLRLPYTAVDLLF